MNPKRGALCLGIILAAVATLLLVILPGSLNLYISYAFCLAGVLLMEAGYFLADRDHVPAAFALLRRCGRFLPLTLLISAVVIALEWMAILSVPYLLHLLLQALVLTAQIYALVRLKAGAAYVEQVNARAAQAAEWKVLADHVRQLAEKEQTPAGKRALQKVSEALRYADPLGTAASREVESKLEADIYALGSSCGDDLISRCSELVALIEKRNALVRNSK